VSDATEAPKKTTVTISVDGRDIEAKPGELVIAAAQRTGTYIPRFCYHERMEPVGMCRMCLVDIDTGRGPALAVSCMTNVAEGMKVDTYGPRVKKAQEGVLEFLLINHPLDCPVCDKGGECPLQDQTLSHGPGESRFVEEKRHYAKPIPISELVHLDRERCILCDRCTRFAKDVAGDPLIHFTNRGNFTQILTFPFHPFASYFSGNTVQICPVGALTARPYRFRARPWDLQTLESTCTTCAVGCRMTVESSRDHLVRYQGVDDDKVNIGWLCDRGRFNFEAINNDQRLAAPLMRKAGGAGDELVEVSWSEALDSAASALRQTLDAEGRGAIAVLGGARGTNEDAYAWVKLAKGVLGTDHVDAQLGDGLPPEFVFGVPAATIDDACAAATVVLLGPDLKEELPVLYLRLRDAAQRRAIRILELSERDTGMTPYAWRTVRHRPGEQAMLVRALVGAGPAGTLGVDEVLLEDARAQLDRGPIVAVVGRANLATASSFTVDAAAALLAAHASTKFLVALRRGNVRGALDMGLAPGLVPGRTALAEASPALRDAWPLVPSGRGLDAGGILAAAADGRIACLVLLGADPVADFPDRDLARRALAGARTVIALDAFLTDSSREADIVLAVSAFAEKDGTTTNFEGRVSPLAQKVTPPGTAIEDWMIAVELADRLGTDLGVESEASIRAEVAAVSSIHEQLGGAPPDGVVVAGSGTSFPIEDSGREPPAPKSYDFRLLVDRDLYDAAVFTAHSPAMAGLARGARVELNPGDADRRGFADGAPVRLIAPRTSIVLAARPDERVPRGVARIAYNQPGGPVNEILDVSLPVTDVRIEVP
jgi:NADH-quinone oxidoreductase subunit G